VGGYRRTVSEESWDHELCTVADGVDSAILDDDSLHTGEEGLERSNDTPQVGFYNPSSSVQGPTGWKTRRLTIPGVVVQPLSIQHVVHRHNVVRLSHRSTPDPPQLLHVPSYSQQQSEVDAERTDVRSCLARDPEDGEVALVVELDEVALVDGSDSELTLDGGDEGGSLEEGSGERLESTRESLLARESSVEANDTDVFLSCIAERDPISHRSPLVQGHNDVPALC
jgi:hypothetical protein